MPKYGTFLLKHPIYIYIYIYIYTGCNRRNGPDFREGVPYVILYRYNPKHLYTDLNGLGDNGN